jgi:hypothetical protein
MARVAEAVAGWPSPPGGVRRSLEWAMRCAP